MMKKTTIFVSRQVCVRGFSIVEVLVSIVVLTVGMLGMVGMQASSLQANRDARLQSVATFQARELAEMMRGNQAIASPPAASPPPSNPYVGSFTAPLTHSTLNYCLNVAASTACPNATDIAHAQMTEWLSRVDTELPNARVVICLDAAPFDATGLSRWACTAGADAAMVIKIGWTRSSTNKSLTGSAALERATVPSVVFPV